MEYPDIIILAGGLGTRLKSEIPDLPKPMAPVNGRPFLEFLLNFIHSYGFRRVILSTGYLGNKIEEHFRNRYQEIEIEYSSEDKPLGTGGAIKRASGLVKTHYFIVMNGDTFFNINLQRFFQVNVENLAKMSIALREVPDASRYGQIMMNDYGIITEYNEKSHDAHPGLINGGTYIINTKYFKQFELPEVFSFERDWIQKHVGKEDIRGQFFNDYFLDIGIPEDYKRAQYELKAFENR
jgi:D-glycero-alpha-D-manno-heptose 1-phosphate guanylyltransferase